MPLQPREVSVVGGLEEREGCRNLSLSLSQFLSGIGPIYENLA